MSTQMSSGDLISDRYALALYELASENNCIDNILKDFNSLHKSILENKDLSLLIHSPLIASNDKLEILLKIINDKSINSLSINFLKVISVNKRFSKIVSIILQFININAQKRGDILADVTSAEELTNEQQQGIKNQLHTILGKKLSLSYKVDKKIIGGLIIKVGSKMIDTSLANKFNKIKIAMKGA